MCVFGRHHGGKHPYHNALQEWRGAGGSAREQAEAGAMTCNVRYDSRVSPARESHFDRVCGAPRDGSQLRDALGVYHHDHVRSRRMPDFLDAHLNSSNILGGIHKDIELGRVLVLNGLRHVFEWARDARLDGFKRYFDSGGAGAGPWLDRVLAPRGTRAEWVERMLDLVNRHARQAPYQPTWCTAWRELEPHLGGGPDAWVGVVGLPERGLPDASGRAPGRWAIVLKYAVRRANRLCRPTILDAGWESYHFPSPPHMARAAGGHAMDVRPSVPDPVLVREYIHEQIDHTLDDWSAAGRLCERTSGAAPALLPRVRKRHHQLLRERYGALVVDAWMPDPC